MTEFKNALRQSLTNARIPSHEQVESSFAKEIAMRIGNRGDNYTLGDADGLFRFYGDINGDRHVDIVDFGLFSSTYNLSSGQTGFIAAFDFNGDGHIDIADFGQFSLRFFTVLP